MAGPGGGPQLQINIGANVAGAVNGLNAVSAAGAAAAASLTAIAPAAGPAGQGLGSVGAAAASTGRGLNALAPAIRPNLQGLTLMGVVATNAGMGLGAIPGQANAASAALARIRPGANQAGSALTNVGRVAQDLPFGFIGIQNNLNPLLESFQRLRAETGSNRAAFRALGSSLLGAGGIGLALSVVSSAILIYQNGIAGFNRKHKEAAEEAKKFVDSLRTVAATVAEAGAGVQGEVAQVDSLARIVRNTNNSYTERAAALRELQKINKSYFGDLKLEESQMGLLSARVNEYTEALIKSSVIKAFQDDIGKINVELVKQIAALDVLRSKKQQADDALAKTPQFKTIRGEEQLTNAFLSATIASDKAKKTFLEQKNVVEKLATSQALLRGSLQTANAEALKFRDLSSATEKTTKKEDETLKALRKELSGYERQLKDINELRSKGALPISRENDALALQQKIFETLGKIDAREVIIKAKPELEINPEILDLQLAEIFREFGIRSASKPSIPVIVRIKPTFEAEFSPADILGPDTISEDAFAPVIEAIRKNAKANFDNLGIGIKDDLENTLANSLLEGIVSAADVFGSAIGDIFSGAGIGEALANAASGFLGIIGGVLQEVGKQIVLTSALVGSLKRALDGIFGPGGEFIAAAAGIALIGLGGVLKNIKFPGFAAGITSFAGGLALVGEDGPEIVRLSPGSDVINNRNMASMGGTIILEPSIKFSGAQFQVMLDRVNKSKAQLG